MTLVGLDFDNTLVCYDNLFYRIALEKNLIESNVGKTKVEIRNSLRAKGRDCDFTELQGEVYGKQIERAEKFEGMFEALKALKSRNISLVIISHKTKYPYRGPQHDLHESALKWLDRNNFFCKAGLNLSRNDVFFLPTKEEKIKKIEELKCDYYVDDLLEILNNIKTSIQGVLYNKLIATIDSAIKMNHWDELAEIVK